MCQCTPAPLALLRQGLFGCAPVHPSIAIDIKMLELVTNLFHNMAPNTTAWCESLDAFLRDLGFKLEHPVRKRSRPNEILLMALRRSRYVGGSQILCNGSVHYAMPRRSTSTRWFWSDGRISPAV